METMGKIKNYLTLLKEYNTTSLKYESLKEQVKDDLFNKMLNKIGEPDEVKRLRKENQRLRIKNKELKKKILNNQR